MKESSFNPENISSSPFCWWMGQIVNDSVWKDNGLASKWMGPEKIQGWGTRYKVRIFGRHSSSNDVPDDQLDWAEVLFPVTAGTGHGGSYESANLIKGSFVFGFYKDGIDKSEPIIMGCIGNNDQTKLAQSIPINGFIPFSGYVQERVSVNSIPGEGSCPPSGPNPRESNTQSSPQESVHSDDVQKDDGNQERSYCLANTCDRVQLGKIQIEIKKFIKEIQNFKSIGFSCNWKNTLLKPIKENGQEFSLSEYISYKAQNVAKFITGGIRNLINDIQTNIKNAINNAAKDFYFILFPNERPQLKRSVETANDLIDCLIRKIVSNLLKMITDILLKIAERFINTPTCAIENIVSSLIGQLLGFITSAVTTIIQPIEALIGSIFDFSDGILNFVTNVLSFISCDETPACPEVIGWSPWKGATTFSVSSDIGNIITKAKNIASSSSQIIDPDNFDFNLNFDNIFQDTCNVGPLFCGPPVVEFYGGGGSGAAGNAIVSATGDILGVDITSPGSGYTSAPVIKFVDVCGKGSGAVGRVVLDSSNQVSQVIIEKPGFNYLSSPNGDRGGDGSVWATKEQTTVKRSDGTYDRPYNPGETFSVNPGDEVYFNGETEIIEFPEDYTAPEFTETNLPRGENPSLNDGNYPVFLELDTIIIDSAGINYNPTNDTIRINPDNGAELTPIFDSLGSLKKVNIVSPGIGFTEMPSIEFQTESGYNALLLPVFKVNRLGDIPDEQDIIVPQNQIISVIDCVGKV